MSLLSEILGSRIRAEILRRLFVHPDREIHVRELQRLSGFNDSAIRQELTRLEKLTLVQSRRDGNRLYFRANAAHPLYGVLIQLILRTDGLVDVLTPYLTDPRIETAFVFGSAASGELNATSDIDLMVLGKMSMRELTFRLKGASDKLGRELNPHLLSNEEYLERLAVREHFIASVHKGEKLLIKGTLGEPGNMGRQRLAKTARK